MAPIFLPEGDPRPDAWNFDMIVFAKATRLDSVRLRSIAEATVAKSRKLKQEAADLRKRWPTGGPSRK